MKKTHDTHADAGHASRAVNLRQLLAGITDVAVPDVTVTDLALDSRAVVKGGLFLAVPGVQGHGLQHLPQAIQAGAAVVLWEPATEIVAPAASSDVLLAAVPGLKAMIGRIADRFFDHPSERVAVVGITGTNGKTTTAHLIAEAMDVVGRSTAYAGTLGFGHVGKLQSAVNTTPDCVTVHRRLAELCAGGDRHMSMEVSSHALDQGRVEGVRFHTAVFTNLTRDHLDYHKTLGAYGAAKAKLFHAPGLNHAVINIGDPFGDELARQLAGKTTVTACQVGAPGGAAAGQRLFARSVERSAAGLMLQFDGSWGAGTLRSSLVGDFNAGNLLAALAVLLGWELPLDRALHALERSSAPPGRMEVVSTTPLAVIDYAHTPDALAKALRALRQHTAGRVICVFGCGGERDRGKRPLMGAIAEELADVVVVTDDNPRRENADAIIADIAAGMQRSHLARIERRRAIAIAEAMALANPDDAVLIAGKGHEEYQIVGTETLPFSDRDSVRQALGPLRHGSQP